MLPIPGEQPQPSNIRGRNWLLLAVFLLGWNGVAAMHASPMSLLQGYDGTQYQLLARNCLAGHTEVGDMAHTVRREGSHPMWRPGLVWLTLPLAFLTGSVCLAAALVSALGTALLELALLWLARRCFGVAACQVAFLCLVMPLSVSAHLLRLAIGAGPEPLATACILGGLAALVEALRRQSWRWAIAAGLAAGLSEWFRTGNLILFAVPCAVHALAGVCQRERVNGLLSALALSSFLAVTAVGGFLIPSRIDKATANLWGNLVEHEGPQVVKNYPRIGPVTFYFGGLTLAPGTSETNYDYIVRRAHDVPARRLLAERWGAIVSLYFSRLGEVARDGAWGLRLFSGDWLPACFLVQVIFSLVRRTRRDVHVLALAGGALAYYLGPVVLLRGDEPTHYLLVMVPLLLLVGAQGVVQIGELIGKALRRWRPLLADRFRDARRPLLYLAAGPVLCLGVSFYQGALTAMEEHRAEAAAEQADLDALPLAGKTVACRNMTWFVDRDVQTILLPYATVAELEKYVRVHAADGILVWENEPSPFFYGTPYAGLAEFDEALRKSPVFGAAQVSGGWRWYPVLPAYPSGGKS